MLGKGKIPYYVR